MNQRYKQINNNKKQMDKTPRQMVKVTNGEQHSKIRTSNETYTLIKRKEEKKFREKKREEKE